MAILSAVIISCNKDDQFSQEAGSARSSGKNQTLSVTDESLFIVDQDNTTNNTNFYYNISHLAPLGQEFIPDLYALDAVEIVIEDGSCSLVGSNGGDLFVRIRENNISGKILGASQPKHFANCFVGKIRFDFAGYIPLEPGRKYIIEPVYLSGNTSLAGVDIYTPGYAKGSFILSGVITPGTDLWFREGLYHAVARNKDQCKNEGWRRLVRKNGTPFKNQGDCIQYINTGK